MIVKGEVEMANMYLRRHVIFSGLADKHIEEVSLLAKLHILKKGKRIGINGLRSSRIYFLVHGKLKILGYAKNNSQPVKDILSPNDMFGNISLNGYEGEEQAEALLHNTLVYCFNVNDFKHLLKQHHLLALNYADKLSTKLNLLKEKHITWSNSNAREKLIFFLRKWALTDGQREDDRILIKNILSLSDIADILSVSRQFMYTLLDNLEKEELLYYDREQIVINNKLFSETEKD